MVFLSGLIDTDSALGFNCMASTVILPLDLSVIYDIYKDYSGFYISFFRGVCHFYLLGKGGYVLAALVCVFVCLSVCLQTTLLKKLWTDWDEILWRGPG